ncbi:MAG: hypothetical protein V1854_05890 [Methanobacteriota archaeon]
MLPLHRQNVIAVTTTWFYYYARQIVDYDRLCENYQARTAFKNRAHKVLSIAGIHISGVIGFYTL